MYKVRTFNQIALRGLERFPRERFEVGSEIADGRLRLFLGLGPSGAAESIECWPGFADAYVLTDEVGFGDWDV